MGIVKRKPVTKKHNIKKILTKPKKILSINKNEWQLQDAKAMFSEVIKNAQTEPQVITVHGKKKAVILSYDEYDELISPKQSIIEFFQKSPLFGFDLELPPRIPEPVREVFL